MSRLSISKMLAPYQQKGVGLIEIMITTVILVTGLTALMKLQAEMFKNDLYTQQRAEAMALVQRKIEDLHSFTTIMAPTNAPDWSANLTTEMAYNYIDTDKGGKIASGIVNDSFAQSAVYTLHWYAVDHESNMALTSATLTTSASRRVSVTVSWTTAIGTTESVTVTDVLTAINPDNSVNGLKNSANENIYPNPAKVSASDLPIVAGLQTTFPTINDTNTKRETNWQEFKIDGRQHKISAVGCSCAQSTSTDTARVASFHDGAGFDLGAWIVKRIGSSNGSDTNCSVCCKDHHDTTFTSAIPSTRYSYSAFRVQAGYRGTATNKDHSHYNHTGTYSNATHSSTYTPSVTYTLADTSGKLYYDACFLEMVNGFVTALEDVTHIDLTIFPENYLQSASNQTLYSNYVKTLLEQTILTIDSSAISSSTRLYASPVLSNNANIKTARSAMNIPTAVTTSSTTALKARIVSLSYMKPWMVAILHCKINGSTITYSNGSAIADEDGVAINCKNYAQDSNWLNYVPFHEVEVTDYVEWLVSNSDKLSGADVVSAGVSARSNHMGLVTVGLAASASAVVTARIRTSNSAYFGPDYFVNAYDDLDRLTADNSITVSKSAVTNTPTPTP